MDRCENSRRQLHSFAAQQRSAARFEPLLFQDQPQAGAERRFENDSRQTSQQQHYQLVLPLPKLRFVNRENFESDRAQAVLLIASRSTGTLQLVADVERIRNVYIQTSGIGRGFGGHVATDGFQPRSNIPEVWM